jgi:hypothetical protein
MVLHNKTLTKGENNMISKDSSFTHDVSSYDITVP